MRRNRPTILAVVVSVLLTASLSAARGAIDLNAAPDGDTSTANLIQVPHANSWQAAVSDRLGQLVIGSFNKKAKDKPGEFVIYPLDGAGALKIATPGKPAVPAVAAVAAVKMAKQPRPNSSPFPKASRSNCSTAFPSRRKARGFR